MSDTKPKPIKAFVIRDFTDAGTEERFTAESTPELEKGRFDNFKAAGLVRLPTAEEAKAKPAA
ncbi:hypothetical protein [Sphingomonas aerolata]|uniref:hypothetical protein n=1 Tax=Sphingomonas aerolata TaxID=185951 RepID=UPI00141A67BC|nr:hypothetical protein [Sphingomonas aerolata]NII59841.1 hypothetical protein [Sphingomonas aerolata]